jgi:hypothetical protein
MLKSRATSAAVWLAFGAAGKVLIQIAQVAILTRLLSPDDFGIMAIVMVVVSVGSLFSDGGLSSAFLQRRDVPDDARSSLYWLNVALALALLAPVLAWIFGEQELTGVILASTPVFALGALGRQFEVASEKSLRFGNLVLIEFCAALHVRASQHEERRLPAQVSIACLARVPEDHHMIGHAGLLRVFLHPAYAIAGRDLLELRADLGGDRLRRDPCVDRVRFHVPGHDAADHGH